MATNKFITFIKNENENKTNSIYTTQLGFKSTTDKQ